MSEAIKITPKISLWLNIAIILLLLIVTVIMLRLTITIKTDGGKCTASPLGYTEYILKEQTSQDYICSCERATPIDLDIRKISID